MYGFGTGGGEGSLWATIVAALISSYFLFGLTWAVATVIVGVRLSRLCKQAGVSNTELSFIPILAETRVARLAGSSPWWNILWLFPVTNLIWLVLVYLWSLKIARAGGKLVWWFVSLAGLVSTVIIPLAEDLPFNSGLLLLVSVVLFVVGRWMLFDPATADRLGLDTATRPSTAPATDTEAASA